MLNVVYHHVSTLSVLTIWLQHTCHPLASWHFRSMIWSPKPPFVDSHFPLVTIPSVFPCRIIKIIPTYNCVLVYLLLRGDEVCIYINDCLWRGVFHYHVIWTRHHNIILLHSCPFVIVIFTQQAENGKLIQ